MNGSQGKGEKWRKSKGKVRREKVRGRKRRRGVVRGIEGGRQRKVKKMKRK